VQLHGGEAPDGVAVCGGGLLQLGDHGWRSLGRAKRSWRRRVGR
jgi:hypothetical protein